MNGEKKKEIKVILKYYTTGKCYSCVPFPCCAGGDLKTALPDVGQTVWTMNHLWDYRTGVRSRLRSRLRPRGTEHIFRCSFMVQADFITNEQPKLWSVEDRLQTVHRTWPGLRDGSKRKTFFFWVIKTCQWTATNMFSYGDRRLIWSTTALKVSLFVFIVLYGLIDTNSNVWQQIFEELWCSKCLGLLGLDGSDMFCHLPLSDLTT